MDKDFFEEKQKIFVANYRLASPVVLNSANIIYTPYHWEYRNDGGLVCYEYV